MVLRLIAFGAFALSIVFSVTVQAANRVALVIGNSNYEFALALRNPVNDARLMTETLEKTGFQVTTLLDANRDQMKKALLNYSRTLRKTGASGLFYYAGHAVEMQGRNFLAPIEMDLQDASEIEILAIDVNAFVSTMEGVADQVNIVILDACRNNPFKELADATRGFGNDGLARVVAPKGTFIAFSTAPGRRAKDGDGANSPYTTALANAMVQNGLTIEQVFKKTRADVQIATDQFQTPWENSSIIGEFYFSGKPNIASEAGDRAFWKAVGASQNPGLIQSYLDEFPGGLFVSDANRELNRLAARPVAKLALKTKPNAKNRQIAVVSKPKSKIVGKSKDIIRECDLAAAHPANGDNPAYAPGVQFGDIDPTSALVICDAAMLKSPNELRIKYQLARINYKAKSYENALTHYRSAANAGYAPAQDGLAHMYFYGDGIKQDQEQGVSWFRKAANANYAPAQYKLGLAIRAGKGVAKNHAEGNSWIRKAADLGFSSAQRFMGRAHHIYTPGFSRDLKQAVSWYRKSADQGEIYAQNRLGFMYEKGLGVETDLNEALVWYGRSAAGGFSKSQLRLAGYHNQRVGIFDAELNAYVYDSSSRPRDPVQAASWLYKALKNGSREALDKNWEQQTLMEFQLQLRRDGSFDGIIDGENNALTKAAMESLCNCR
ncbi:MAG: caspase family protein [Cohaesibacteraceae bacterium]|nr:caspase family protein [Cohaesibacteraceae bacterium]